MQRHQVRIRDFIESIIVTLVMLLIFLPLRVIFTTWITPNWISSFGMLSAVIITLLYLSKKDKLGMFGRMFWRQSTKIHKGRRRIVSYAIIILAVYFWGSIIYGINYAENNPKVQELILQFQASLTEQDKQKILEFEDALESQNVEKARQMLQERYNNLNWNYFLLGVPIMFFLPFINIDLWSVAVFSMNMFTNGYFLHFGTVFFLEVLEVIGIMIYVRIETRKEGVKTDKV